MKLWFWLLTSLLLVGCAGPPKPETVTDFDAPPLPHDQYAGHADTIVLDADRLKIFVRVGKTGSLANLGHEHAIEVGTLQGYARWPGDLASARADIEFQLHDLKVDTRSAKKALGVDNDLDRQQKADTRANMLKSLDAEQFPTVRIQLREFEKTSEEGTIGWQAQATLWLHGTRHSYPINLVPGANPQEPVTGTLTFNQTRFGIQPFSALNGGLQVSDELRVHFRINALPDQG